MDSPISVKDNFPLPRHTPTTVELYGLFPFPTLVKVTENREDSKMAGQVQGQRCSEDISADRRGTS